MSSTLHRPAAPSSLALDVRRAWLRYLRETRSAAPGEYQDVEERAWHRLASNLAALGAPVDPDRRDRSS